jgi:hypothetical protein
LTEVKTFLDPGLENEDDRRYFRVLFFSGLRPGEQIGLQWDDIDWQRKIICVRRSIGRFGKGPTKTAESMLELDESPGCWVARQLGHTNAGMSIGATTVHPNLRGRDGVNAAKTLAVEGHRGRPWSLDGHSTQEKGYESPRNPLKWSGRPDSNRRRPAWEVYLAPQPASRRSRNGRLD